MTIMHFQIGNVTCTGCTGNIEKKITEKYEDSGLVEVTATLMTYKLTVKIKSEAAGYITPEAIESLIREMGKECNFLNSENVDPFLRKQTSSKRRILDENGEF